VFSRLIAAGKRTEGRRRPGRERVARPAAVVRCCTGRALRDPA